MCHMLILKQVIDTCLLEGYLESEIIILYIYFMLVISLDTSFGTVYLFYTVLLPL